MDYLLDANGSSRSSWTAPTFKQSTSGQSSVPTPQSHAPLTGFGSTSPSSATFQSSMNGTGDATGNLFSQDDSWAYGGYDNDHDNDDGQGDAKRRRIARACDSCRRKKIKCDAKMPKCSHCENYRTECVFTHVEKKRTPPKGAKYIEGLENRLGRMEHLLRLSGLLNDDDEGGDLSVLEQRLAQQVNSNRPSPAPGTAHSRTRPNSQQGQQNTSHRSNLASPRSGRSSPHLQHGEQKAKEHSKKKDDGKDVDDLADMMWCSLMTNSQGETRFIGSSSGFSIFSPKGIEWVNEKTGDESFNNMIARISEDESRWVPWREEVFNDIFYRKVFKPLPPREECESLMTEFFESFNRMFPLFHEPTFMHLVDMQYSSQPYDGSGWWASLNVALAIAHRIRMLKHHSPQDHEGHSWAYFKNALAVLSELTMRNTDLLSVQALIGMCLFLQGSPNPQPSFFLISAAIRLAHSIGLHKHGDGFGLNKTEVEQRKRVFWIAYMIDKDICIRSGRPPAQDDDDWNVDLPSEEPDDGVGTIPLADGSTTNLFLLLCQYGVISAKVYNKLYSVKAAKQSDGELLSTIGELDAELEKWKNSIPVDFRPEHELSALPPHLVIHILILHFSYYNCLTTIHRRSVHHGYWTSRLSDFAQRGLNVKPLNPRVFSSAALCVSAARTSIHLTKYIPESDTAFIWLILYYPISAMVTLFANILQNPQDVRARGDLKLISFFVDFLQRIAAEDATASLKRHALFCNQLRRIAEIVLDRAEHDMSTSQKRKQEREREKLAKRPLESVEIPQPTRNSVEVQRPEEGFPYYPKPSQVQQQRSKDNLQDNSAVKNEDMLTGGFSTGLDQNSFQRPPYMSNDFTDQPNNPSTTWFPSFSGNDATPFPPQDMSQNGQSFQNPKRHSAFSSDLMASAFDNGNTGTSTPDHNSNTFPGPTFSGSGFQQPMVPQELWNMPMTFEWDWAMPDSMGSFGMTPCMTPGLNMPQMPSYDMAGFGTTNDANGGSNIQGQAQEGQSSNQGRRNQMSEGRG